MNIVSLKKVFRVVVTGNFGVPGFVQQVVLLIERSVEVLHTDFSNRDKSPRLQDAATFDVRTDLNDTQLRALLSGMEGVQNATVVEANNV